MAESARVAVVGPFSGPRAAWGELLTAAVAAAGEAPVRWEPLDDRGDAGEAAARAGEVVADGGYAAVLGHFNSLGARAALPRYRDAELPVLLPLASAPGLLAAGGGWAVRWCPDDAGQAAAIAAAVRARGGGPARVVHDGTPYGRELAERLAAAGAGAPGELVAGGGPLVLCGAHRPVAALVVRARAAGVRGPVVVSDDCQVEEFRRLVGTDPGEVLVARWDAGPRALVGAAVAALAGALAVDPAARGAALLAAVRARAGIPLTAEGDPAGASSGRGWEVVPLPAAPDGAARPD